MHHTSQLSTQQPHQAVPFFETILAQALPLEPAPSAPRHRGRPPELSWPHLWFRLIIGVLQGMNSYQDLWRRLNSETLGPFPALEITDDAFLKRLRKIGTQPLLHILACLSTVLSRRLQP